MGVRALALEPASQCRSQALTAAWVACLGAAPEGAQRLESPSACEHIRKRPAGRLTLTHFRTGGYPISMEALLHLHLSVPGGGGLIRLVCPPDAVMQLRCSPRTNVSCAAN